MRCRTSSWSLRGCRGAAGRIREAQSETGVLTDDRKKSRNRKRRHLPGDHGDVVEISLTSLFDGQREEKPAPVPGEQRLLPLHTQTHRQCPAPTEGAVTGTGRGLTCLESQVSDESACL